MGGNGDKGDTSEPGLKASVSIASCFGSEGDEGGTGAARGAEEGARVAVAVGSAIGSVFFFLLRKEDRRVLGASALVASRRGVQQRLDRSDMHGGEVERSSLEERTSSSASFCLGGGFPGSSKVTASFLRAMTKVKRCGAALFLTSEYNSGYE